MVGLDGCYRNRNIEAPLTTIADISSARQTARMMGRLFGCITLLLLAASPAQAVCSGETLQQEFRQADVVVRARMVSEVNTWNDEPSTSFRARWGDGGPVVLYNLRALEIFKGAPGSRISFFQERNSGAFYLDPDKDYLLFLNYIPPYAGRPTAARGAMHVRYACGQSKLWSEVQMRDLVALRRLSSPR